MDIKKAKSFAKELKQLVVESDSHHKIRVSDDKLRFFVKQEDGTEVELELVHEPESLTYNGIYFDQNWGCGCGLGVDVYFKVKGE